MSTNTHTTPFLWTLHLIMKPYLVNICQSNSHYFCYWKTNPYKNHQSSNWTTGKDYQKNYHKAPTNCQNQAPQWKNETHPPRKNIKECHAPPASCQPINPTYPSTNPTSAWETNGVIQAGATPKKYGTVDSPLAQPLNPPNNQLYWSWGEHQLSHNHGHHNNDTRSYFSDNNTYKSNIKPNKKNK